MKALFFIHVLAVAAMAMADEKKFENLLHEGNNKLTAQMFTEVSNANKGESFILSAYSVMTPLAQLALASVDDAQKELLDAIGMPNENTTKEVFTLVDKKLRSVNGITLKSASKIYVAEDYELNEKFALDTRNTFNSDVQNINFLDNKKAAKEVNTWVEEQTNNRIKDLVKPEMLTADTRALLVNAIYFKGSWQLAFDKDSTADYDFYVNRTKTTTVPMMSSIGDYRYTESYKLKSQIIGIPYEGGESSFVVVLPLDKDGINEVMEKFKDPSVLDDVLKDMWETEVELYLPKFKIETTTDLKGILSNMNVTRMFDERTAKLYNLIKGVGTLSVGSAKQKAFIEVNEEGAEAAAANEFSVTTSYVNMTIQFLADHPFIFFLRARENTLFSGAYYS